MIRASSRRLLRGGWRAKRPGERQCSLRITHNFASDSGQSQRDCVSQPRVARHELPWVCGHKRFQPQRGCVRRATDDATPLGLRPISSRFPRVASPTRQPLGFATESRWDSDRATAVGPLSGAGDSERARKRRSSARSPKPNGERHALILMSCTRSLTCRLKPTTLSQRR